MTFYSGGGFSFTVLEDFAVAEMDANNKEVVEMDANNKEIIIMTMEGE